MRGKAFYFKFFESNIVFVVSVDFTCISRIVKLAACQAVKRAFKNEVSLDLWTDEGRPELTCEVFNIILLNILLLFLGIHGARNDRHLIVNRSVDTLVLIQCVFDFLVLI